MSLVVKNWSFLLRQFATEFEEAVEAMGSVEECGGFVYVVHVATSSINEQQRWTAVRARCYNPTRIPF